MSDGILKQLGMEPAALAFEILDDELTGLLRANFTQVNESTAWIDFPSGYQIVVVCRVMDPAKPCPHLEDGAFDDLAQEAGADVIYFVIGHGDTGPPVARAQDVIGEVHVDLDVDPYDDEEFYYDLARWQKKRDPYKELLSEIIRVAAYRTVDTWGPLSFEAIARGVGVTIAIASGKFAKQGVPFKLLASHLGRCDGYGKWKKRWRVDSVPKKGNGYRRLAPLPELALAAIKARARAFAKKFPSEIKPKTAVALVEAPPSSSRSSEVIP